MTGTSTTKRECPFCKLLKASIWAKKEKFRCSAGRFDDSYGDVYFSWGGIWRPNKTVTTAQKECPCFEVDPQKATKTPLGG